MNTSKSPEELMSELEEWIHQASGHIVDLLKSDDGQAHKEARKFLTLHFPELIEKHNL